MACNTIMKAPIPAPRESPSVIMSAPTSNTRMNPTQVLVTTPTAPMITKVLVTTISRLNPFLEGKRW
jgi:hypothetical protein